MIFSTKSVLLRAMHLEPRAVEIIMSNEHLSARELSLRMALSPRTVEGVRRRYSARSRGRPRSPWLMGVLRRWPGAPARAVAGMAGVAPSTVRRARRVGGLIDGAIEAWRKAARPT